MKVFKFKFKFRGPDIDKWLRYLRFIKVKFDNPYKDAE